jgi:nucleoside-diphosphate-sugar epimerase
MATAFVTGGSGFVGRNLIRALRARGDAVRALARSEAAQAAVRAAGAEPVAGDLDDAAALRRGIEGASAVYHAAAKVDDFGDPAEFERVNVTGTENVLRAAESAGAPRFVHVSTEAVLVGGPPIVDADESWPLPAHPIGLYPRTKGLAEERVRAAAARGLGASIIRPRFIWGRDDSSLLPRFAEAVRKGQFVWFGGGRYRTSTCHIDNVCEGALLAAERGRPGEAYFLTDGPPVEFRAFLTELLATQGLSVENARSIPPGVARFAGAAAEALWSWLPLSGHPPLSRAAVRLIGEEVTVSDARARRELGYQGRTTRAEGLRELAERADQARPGASHEDHRPSP